MARPKRAPGNSSKLDLACASQDGKLPNSKAAPHNRPAPFPGIERGCCSASEDAPSLQETYATGAKEKKLNQSGRVTSPA